MGKCGCHCNKTALSDPSKRKNIQGSTIAKLQLGRNPVDPGLHPHRQIRGTRTFAGGFFLNSTRVSSSLTRGSVWSSDSRDPPQFCFFFSRTWFREPRICGRTPSRRAPPSAGTPPVQVQISVVARGGHRPVCGWFSLNSRISTGPFADGLRGGPWRSCLFFLRFNTKGLWTGPFADGLVPDQTIRK